MNYLAFQINSQKVPPLPAIAKESSEEKTRKKEKRKEGEEDIEREVTFLD